MSEDNPSSDPARPAPPSPQPSHEERPERLRELENALSGLDGRLAGLEKELSAARRDAAGQGRVLEARLGEAASREEVKKIDFKLGYLAALVEGMKKSIGVAGDLLSEPDASAENGAALEKEVSALRDSLAAQGEALRAGLAALPQPVELLKLSARLARLEAALENKPEPAPPAPVAPTPERPSPAPEADGHLKERLDAADKAILEIRSELSALRDNKERAQTPPSIEPPPASALGRLFGGAAAEAALAKAAAVESQFSVLRKDFQAQIRKSLEGLATREDIREAELRVSGLAASIDALKKNSGPQVSAGPKPALPAGAPPPPPPQKQAAQEQSKPVPAADLAGKADLERIERKVSVLAEALDSIGKAAAQAPAAAPAASPAALQALGSELAAVRAELASQREWFKSGLELAAGRSELKKLDFRVNGLSASFEELTGSFASAYDLGARLKSAEEGLAGLRLAFEERNSALERRLGLLAGREELSPLLAEFGALRDACAAQSAAAASLTSEFGAIGEECRRALGEVRGHAKAIERRIAGEGFEEHLRASVERLSARLAEAETALHAGFSEVSGRLTSSEILYKKMFADAEGRLRKAVEPELKSLDGSLRTLREKVLWLTDEYDVVMKRKIRALEGKYSVLELIEKRLGEKDGR